MRRAILTLGLAVGLGGSLLLSGCSSSSKTASPTTSAGSSSTSMTTSTTSATTSGTASAVTGPITVFAAASLKGTFTDIAAKFEAAYPGTKVTLSFAGSSDLATSIDNDAPGDVFASASKKTMTTVVTAGHASNPVNIARNVMEIVTPPGNPKKITGIADLANSSLKVVICKAGVPCGDAATALFAAAKVTVTPVSLEADVKSTLAKVQGDEADAGIVYVTDVKAAGSKVTGVEIPADLNFTTSYPIATLSQSKNVATATAFVDYVKGTVGEGVLAAAGFLSP